MSITLAQARNPLHPAVHSPAPCSTQSLHPTKAAEPCRTLLHKSKLHTLCNLKYNHIITNPKAYVICNQTTQKIREIKTKMFLHKNKE